MDMPMSRSEQKRRIKQLEQLVAELCTLPAGVVKEIPCSEETRLLIKETASLKGGARKRQVKYITKLLREEPAEPLYDFLAARRGASLKEKKQFHEIEYYRDALLSEAIEHERQCREFEEVMEEQWPSRVAEEIQKEFPDIELTLVLRLAKGYAMTRHRRHARELFRLLRAAQERKEFAGKM